MSIKARPAPLSSTGSADADAIVGNYLSVAFAEKEGTMIGSEAVVGWLSDAKTATNEGSGRVLNQHVNVYRLTSKSSRAVANAVVPVSAGYLRDASIEPVSDDTGMLELRFTRPLSVPTIAGSAPFLTLTVESGSDSTNSGEASLRTSGALAATLRSSGTPILWAAGPASAASSPPASAPNSSPSYHGDERGAATLHLRSGQATAARKHDEWVPYYIVAVWCALLLILGTLMAWCGYKSETLRSASEQGIFAPILLWGNRIIRSHTKINPPAAQTATLNGSSNGKNNVVSQRVKPRTAANDDRKHDGNRTLSGRGDNDEDEEESDYTQMQQYNGAGVGNRWVELLPVALNNHGADANANAGGNNTALTQQQQQQQSKATTKRNVSSHEYTSTLARALATVRALTPGYISHATLPHMLFFVLVATMLIVFAITRFDSKPTGSQAWRGALGDTTMLCLALTLLAPNRHSAPAFMLQVPWESAVIWHRLAGRVALIFSIAHFALGPTAAVEHPTGLAAFILLMLIAVLSVGPLRRMSYNAFYVLHMLMSPALLILACFHAPTVRTLAILVIPVAVKLADWACRAGERCSTAHLLSLRAYDKFTEVTVRAPKGLRWDPGAHCHLYIPALDAAVAHPFSVVNAVWCGEAAAGVAAALRALDSAGLTHSSMIINSGADGKTAVAKSSSVSTLGISTLAANVRGKRELILPIIGCSNERSKSDQRKYFYYPNGIPAQVRRTNINNYAVTNSSLPYPVFSHVNASATTQTSARALPPLPPNSGKSADVSTSGGAGTSAEMATGPSARAPLPPPSVPPEHFGDNGYLHPGQPSYTRSYTEPTHSHSYDDYDDSSHGHTNDEDGDQSVVDSEGVDSHRYVPWSSLLATPATTVFSPHNNLHVNNIEISNTASYPNAGVHLTETNIAVTGSNSGATNSSASPDPPATANATAGNRLPATVSNNNNAHVVAVANRPTNANTQRTPRARRHFPPPTSVTHANGNGMLSNTNANLVNNGSGNIVDFSSFASATAPTPAPLTVTPWDAAAAAHRLPVHGHLINAHGQPILRGHFDINEDGIDGGGDGGTVSHSLVSQHQQQQQPNNGGVDRGVFGPGNNAARGSIHMAHLPTPMADSSNNDMVNNAIPTNPVGMRSGAPNNSSSAAVYSSQPGVTLHSDACCYAPAPPVASVPGAWGYLTAKPTVTPPATCPRCNHSYDDEVDANGNIIVNSCKHGGENCSIGVAQRNGNVKCVRCGYKLTTTVQQQRQRQQQARASAYYRSVAASLGLPWLTPATAAAFGREAEVTDPGLGPVMTFYVKNMGDDTWTGKLHARATQITQQQRAKAEQDKYNADVRYWSRGETGGPPQTQRQGNYQADEATMLRDCEQGLLKLPKSLPLYPGMPVSPVPPAPPLDAVAAATAAPPAANAAVTAGSTVGKNEQLGALTDYAKRYKDGSSSTATNFPAATDSVQDSLMRTRDGDWGDAKHDEYNSKNSTATLPTNAHCSTSTNAHNSHAGGKHARNKKRGKGKGKHSPSIHSPNKSDNKTHQQQRQPQEEEEEDGTVTAGPAVALTNAARSSLTVVSPPSTNNNNASRNNAGVGDTLIDIALSPPHSTTTSTLSSKAALPSTTSSTKDVTSKAQTQAASNKIKSGDLTKMGSLPLIRVQRPLSGAPYLSVSLAHTRNLLLCCGGTGITPALAYVHRLWQLSIIARARAVTLAVRARGVKVPAAAEDAAGLSSLTPPAQAHPDVFCCSPDAAQELRDRRCEHGQSSSIISSSSGAASAAYTRATGGAHGYSTTHSHPPVNDSVWGDWEEKGQRRVLLVWCVNDLELLSVVLPRLQAFAAPAVAEIELSTPLAAPSANKGRVDLSSSNTSNKNIQTTATTATASSAENPSIETGAAVSAPGRSDVNVPSAAPASSIASSAASSLNRAQAWYSVGFIHIAVFYTGTELYPDNMAATDNTTEYKYANQSANILPQPTVTVAKSGNSGSQPQGQAAQEQARSRSASRSKSVVITDMSGVAEQTWDENAAHAPVLADAAFNGTLLDAITSVTPPSAVAAAAKHGHRGSKESNTYTYAGVNTGNINANASVDTAANPGAPPPIPPRPAHSHSTAVHGHPAIAHSQPTAAYSQPAVSFAATAAAPTCLYDIAPLALATVPAAFRGGVDIIVGRPNFKSLMSAFLHTDEVAKAKTEAARGGTVGLRGSGGSGAGVRAAYAHRKQEQRQKRQPSDSDDDNDDDGKEEEDEQDEEGRVGTGVNINGSSVRGHVAGGHGHAAAHNLGAFQSKAAALAWDHVLRTDRNHRTLNNSCSGGCGLDASDTAVFTCGPEAMVTDVRAVALEMDIPVHSEQFYI